MWNATPSSQVLPNVRGSLAGRFLPHSRYRNWLGSARSMALLDYALENERRFEPTTVRAIGGGCTVDLERRSSLRVKDLGPIAATLREQILKTLPAIHTELGVPAFEPNALEVEMVAHGDGAFYLRHNDMFSPSTLLPRRISMVYYFHRLPKAFTGGQLRYYSLDGTTHLDIEPECDQLVAFPSWAPHSVERVTVPSSHFADSRFAVNVWVSEST